MKWQLGLDFINVDDTTIAGRSQSEIGMMEYLTFYAEGTCLNIGLGVGVAMELLEKKGCEQWVVEKYPEVVNYNVKRIEKMKKAAVVTDDWHRIIFGFKPFAFDFILWDSYFPGDKNDLSLEDQRFVYQLINLLKADGYLCVVRDRELPLITPEYLQLLSSKSYGSPNYVGQVYERKEKWQLHLTQRSLK